MSSSGAAGLVVVDKPGGMTSHDVVSRVRRLAGTRKVGHAGTLDPMATGVLVLGVNRATRLLGHLMLTEKAYDATVRLGQSTSTDDAEGETTSTTSAGDLTEGEIRSALERFVGDIEQVPTAVSAIKVDGKRAYQRVRDGEQVELKARPVTVHEIVVHSVVEVDPTVVGEADAHSVVEEAEERGRLETTPTVVEDVDPTVVEEVAQRPSRNHAFLDADPTVVEEAEERGRLETTPTFLDVRISVRCSSGTYIRAIARDLGEALGVGGHLTALRRTAVGNLDLSMARTLDELADGFTMVPIAEAARASFPAYELDDEQARDVRFGRKLPIAVDATTAVFAPDGEFLALYEPVSTMLARPTAVFVG